ncbi:hypothetical protein E2562_007119 [Oryza meyeriana var. granulata]|uniref:Uncharacterized protein n=1 Tax=Oryza meyeriana var. granulata TaxID=110450 RepID=A0A6G1F528_9ORYZ|nr:hypothetical protein E2562_007119 [Oryza meyeriana var. granulata]
MGSKQGRRAFVLLCAAVALLSMAAASTNETAWERVEDLAAEWELPVETAGELLDANAIEPGALRPNRQSCVGGGCAANGGGGYHGRGCNRVLGCHGN